MNPTTLIFLQIMRNRLLQKELSFLNYIINVFVIVKLKSKSPVHSFKIR